MRPDGYVDPGTLSTDYAGRKAPSYLPFLAALIRSAASQDEASYYAGLRKSLGLPETWYSAELARMEELWHDLARWSSQDDAPFGRFVFRKLGGYRYIGAPRSQSIISRRDAVVLTRVFAQCGIRAGQRVTTELITEVHLRAADAPFLSAPFRSALNNSAFTATVGERLRSLLEDWDGTVVGLSNRVTTGAGSGGGAVIADAPEDIETVLALGAGNTMPWQIRWRVPPVRDVGSAILRHAGYEWVATLAGTDRVITQAISTSESTPRAAQALLERSERDDVPFSLEVMEDGSAALPSRVVLLPHRILRSFVAVRDAGAEGQVILLERALPAHGGGYLLAAAENVSRLHHVLSVNHLQHQPCPTDGLPDQWALVFLPDCSELTERVRDELPNGDVVRSQARPVRLVGGRAIQRAGLRQYLAYDLPRVELDAPADTILSAAGLSLTERVNTPPTSSRESGGAPVGEVSTLRQFDIAINGTQARSFEIRATREGQAIGEVRLRIAAGGGLQTLSAGNFKLDPLGNPTTSSDGLLGVLDARTTPLGLRTAESETVLPEINPGRIGRALDSNDSSRFCELVATRFLDSLAQHNSSVAYGVARDQIYRLMENAGGLDEYTPVTVLTELRSRGFLEIESDSKGRMVRVHAVPPALCVLPHLCLGRRVMAFPTGTLRHQHWRELCESRPHDITASRGCHGDSTLLPPLWIIAPTLGEMRTFAEESSLRFMVHPAHDVADWAASIEDVWAALGGTGVESLVSGDRPVERYNPNSGSFFPSTTGAGLTGNIQRQLFRVEDPETGSHHTYSLGFWDESCRPRYSFVRDSRWGVWLALSAFAEFVKIHWGIGDASPWPLHHDSRDHTLWLPARINLPVVLERALVLCSGNRPVRLRVFGEADGESYLLRQLASGETLGAVSPVYTEFAPSAPRWSTWLGLPVGSACRCLNGGSKARRQYPGFLDPLVRSQPRGGSVASVLPGRKKRNATNLTPTRYSKDVMRDPIDNLRPHPALDQEVHHDSIPHQLADVRG